MFTIVNGYEDVDRNMFFKLKESSRTRGHKAALVKEQCRLHIDEKIVGLSISQWLPCPLSLWNLLFGMAILLNRVKSLLNLFYAVFSCICWSVIAGCMYCMS